MPFIPLVPREPLLPQVAQVVVLGGALLGALGSSLSLRRHLRAEPGQRLGRARRALAVRGPPQAEATAGPGATGRVARPGSPA